MKRSLLVWCALAVLASSPAFAAGSWLKSVAAAQAEAKKTNRLIFVDLFANWCGWCHKMEREVFPTEAFQKATKDMVLLRVNTEDRGEGTKLSREYNITKLPTFLVLTHDGLIGGILYGYAPPDEFARRVREVETKYNAFRKEVSQESTFKNDYGRRLSLAVDFISRQGYSQAEPRLRSLVAEKKAPKDVVDAAWFHIALAQYAQRKLNDSVKTLQQLMTRNPKGEALERGKVLLGQIYYEQGNYNAALVELRNFKKNHPSSTLMATVNSLLPIVENAVLRK